jgi:hypothetical protein
MGRLGWLGVGLVASRDVVWVWVLVWDRVWNERDGMGIRVSEPVSVFYSCDAG